MQRYENQPGTFKDPFTNKPSLENFVRFTTQQVIASQIHYQRSGARGTCVTRADMLVVIGWSRPPDPPRLGK